ncbi:MAG TPA: hypothetical protein VIM53_02670 [Candidatus Saccharimonadales bacterium]
MGETSSLHARGHDKRPDVTYGNSATLTLFHRALRANAVREADGASAATGLPSGDGPEVVVAVNPDALTVTHLAKAVTQLVVENPTQLPQMPLIPEQQ